MNVFDIFLSQVDVHALGWTLLHFIWQGATIALLLKCGQRLSHSASVRYGFACIALGFMIAAPILTYTLLHTPISHPQKPLSFTYKPVQTQNISRPNPKEPSAPIPTKTYYSAIKYPQNLSIAPQAVPIPALTRTQQLINTLNRHINWFVIFWVLGVLFLSLRLLYVWLHTQNLKYKHTQPTSQDLEHLLNHLLKRLKITKAVMLLESTVAKSPLVIGWLKPVILIPTGAFLGLTTQQIEAILVHELAHIRRYDYLVNILQSLVETMLFYHPAVWWMSRQLRIEREHCCDDLVVATCGNAITYARALAQLETHRHLPAVAASDGPLIKRIQRILSPKTSKSKRHPYVPFGVWSTLGLGIWLFVTFNTASSPQIEAASPVINLEKITSVDSAIAHVKSRYMAFDFEAGFIEGEKLSQRFPNASELKAWNIWNMARRGWNVSAVDEAEKMLEKNETDPWAWFALTGALAYADHQEHFRTRAYKAHLKFLELNPTYPDSIWLTATAIHRQYHHKKDEIIPYADTHVHTAPNPDYLLTLKGFILGWMSQRKNVHPTESYRRFVAALDAFEKARSINPQNVWAHYLPALIYTKKHRHVEAKFLFGEALKLSPKAPYICSMYLNSLYQSAALPEHKQMLAQAIIDTMLKGRETYPHTVQTAYINYEKFELTYKAKQLEETILKLSPDDPIAKRIRLKHNNDSFTMIYPNPTLELEATLYNLERISSSQWLKSSAKDSSEHPKNVQFKLLPKQNTWPNLDKVIVGLKNMFEPHRFYKTEQTPSRLWFQQSFHDYSTHLRGALYQPPMSHDSLLTIAKRTMDLNIPQAYNYQWQAIIACIDRSPTPSLKNINISLKERTAYYQTIETFANQLMAQANDTTDSTEVKHIQALGYDALGWLFLKERRWEEAHTALQKANGLKQNGTILYHLGKYHETVNDIDAAEKFYEQGLFAPMGTYENEWRLRSIYRTKNQTREGFYAYIEQLAREQLDHALSDPQ